MIRRSQLFDLVEQGAEGPLVGRRQPLAEGAVASGVAAAARRFTAASRAMAGSMVRRARIMRNGVRWRPRSINPLADFPSLLRAINVPLPTWRHTEPSRSSASSALRSVDLVMLSFSVRSRSAGSRSPAS